MIKVYFNGTVNEDYNRDGSNSTVVVNNGGERNDKHIFITWCRLISDTKKWTPLACARAHCVIWSSFAPRRVNWLIL